MEAVTGIGSRIMEIIFHYRLNKNSFSTKLDLSGNSLISRVTLDPDAGISLELAIKILTVFEEISPDWFLLNKGPMLRIKRDIEKVNHTINYYRGNMTEAYDIMKVTGYEECAHAFDVIGDSMSPRYQTGDIVICQESDVMKLSFGEAHLLYINDRPMIRLVKKGPDSDSVRLTAENPKFDDLIIKSEEISKLFLIKGVIRREVF